MISTVRALALAAIGAVAGTVGAPCASLADPAPRGVPVAAPHDPPKIVRVEVSARNVRAGQVVLGHVVTSSNVASVVASVPGFTALLNKVGVGSFRLAYTLPSVIPWFVHGTYPMRIIARNVDGVQTIQEIPMTLR